eukprot:3934640-Rhodomonas_salina.4
MRLLCAVQYRGIALCCYRLAMMSGTDIAYACTAPASRLYAGYVMSGTDLAMTPQSTSLARY